MPIARYPRFGQLLAPKTLRPILDVPLPRYVVKRFAHLELQQARLADLDATSWERFGERVCKKLANAIIKQVSRVIRHPFAAIRGQRLPPVESAIPIYYLPLERRTYNCLCRAHLAEDARQLGDLTIGALLALRAFGARCLVDLLSALEAMPSVPASPFSPMGRSATPALPSPASLSWLEWARADYSYLPVNAPEWTFPDLPPTLTLEQLNIDNHTRRCLHHSGWGKKLSALSGSPILQLLKIPWIGLGSMRSLLRGLDAALHPLPQPPAPDLETELLNVFLPNYSKNRGAKADRNRRLFIRHYGLDGKGGALLETVGRSERLSRERVRQVCKLRPRPGRSAPRLELVLQTIAESSPAPASHIEAELVRRGLVSQHLPLTSLTRFAQTLDHPLPFQLICFEHLPWVIRSNQERELLSYLVKAARGRICRYGATSIADIAAHVAEKIQGPIDPALVRRTLELLSGFCWLEEATGWFWIRSPYSDNPVFFYLRKFLAAVGRLPIDEVCERIHHLPGSYHPNGRFGSLPRRILKNLCLSMPNVRLEGEDLVADPPLDWRVVLRGTERKLVGIFHQYGPLLHIKDIRGYSRRRGIGEHALWMTLHCVPAIRRYAVGVYGLCGIRNYPTKPNG